MAAHPTNVPDAMRYTHRAEIYYVENHQRHTWQNSDFSSGEEKLGAFYVGVRCFYSHNEVHADKWGHKSS